jgi:glycosyltransferase involved in cell wall biosynthesis
MFQIIKNIFFSTQTYKLENFLLQIDNLIDKNYLSICPENTNNNWLGIKNASNALFSFQNIALPQNFSNQIVSDEDLNTLIIHFKNNGGKHIILNGFPEYFSKIVDICFQNQIKCTIIYHGGLAELNQNRIGQNKMKILFELAKQGKIQQFGVIKKGLEVLFHQQTQVPCYHLSIPFQLPLGIKFQKYNDEKIHIGVFGNNSYNKNRHTQVAAASLIPNSIVHFIGQDEFDYLLPSERKVQHTIMDYPTFLSVLASMDINLYCSFTESFGQVVLESLALGVPCLHNNNSGILDDYPALQESLIVNDYDNIQSISNQINKALKHKLDIQKNSNLFLNDHNFVAQQKINEILF